MSVYIVPLLILALIIYSQVKKINTYSTFVEGVKKSLNLMVSVFPYIVAIFIVVELFRASDLSMYLSNGLAPFFNVLGIPKELIELTLLRPFTGSGSLALLSEIYNTYGADTYIGRSASVIMGSSETVFYVSAIYFSKTNIKKLSYAIPVALFCSLVGAVSACFICRFI